MTNPIQVPFVPTIDEIQKLPTAMKDQLLMSLSLTYCQLLNAVHNQRQTAAPQTKAEKPVNSVVNLDMRIDWIRRERAHVDALNAAAQCLNFHDFLCLWAITEDKAQIAQMANASLAYMRAVSSSGITSPTGRTRQLTKLVGDIAKLLHVNGATRWRLSRAQGDDNSIDPASILLKDVKSADAEWRALLQNILFVRSSDWQQALLTLDAASETALNKLVKDLDIPLMLSATSVQAAERAYRVKWRTLLRAESANV